MGAGSSASRRRPRRPRLGPLSRSATGGSLGGGGIPSAARSAVCLSRPRRRDGARCGSSRSAGASSIGASLTPSGEGAEAIPGERRRRLCDGPCGSSDAAGASCAGGPLASASLVAAGERRPRRRAGVCCGPSATADVSCAGASPGCAASAGVDERRPRPRAGARCGSSAGVGVASTDASTGGAASAVVRRRVVLRRGRGRDSSGGPACWGSCTISSDLSSQGCRSHRADCCSSTFTEPRTYSEVVAML